MQKNTKEEHKIIEEKLKFIGLDLEKVPQSLLNVEKIKYKPLKTYEDNNYKIYKYVDVKNIEILITPVDRLDDLNDKLKKALPLAVYLNSESEETIEQYTTFLEMLNNLELDKVKKIEEEQKALSKEIPYEIKYKDNYIWQIYYSEIEDKYFMLFSSNDNNTEALFYLIKKKIQAQKTRKKDKIYVPISHMEYSNKILKRTEIADLENYLWFFTKEWPNIYEVYNQNNQVKIEIVGKTKVYEGVKSLYKITLENKEDAQEKFKLLKALFILQSNDEMEYDFKTIINENGGIDFCYNLKKITYENLSEFIRQEVEVKQEKINNLYNENILIAENLELLKQTVKKQNEEYLIKEKQIANFLECKKTFFGRVKYFFKKGNKIKQINQINNAVEKEEKDSIEIEQIQRIEKKDLYTIEDLLKICEVLKHEENKLKNMQMDIRALENKKENLERKIQNATLYINEIESHKKSIFDFWKFTNKDEVNLLMQAEELEKENANKLKKQFNYEEDLEDIGKLIDSKQRDVFTKNECDAVFAIRNDINTFNILNKEKILKKDDTLITKTIKELKQEYENNIDTIREKDFDIFGNVAQDKTKIKVLKNNKHREIEKDKYKILGVNPEITLEEYKANLENYRKLLKEAYGKMVTPYDISVYKVSSRELNEKFFEILDINPKNEIEENGIEEKVNLYKLNVKEKMPIIFYSNIMFYDNLNKTLPIGMDIESKVLIDLSKFDMKLVSRKDFYINSLKNEFENNVQLFQVYEYELNLK